MLAIFREIEYSCKLKTTNISVLINIHELKLDFTILASYFCAALKGIKLSLFYIT